MRGGGGRALYLRFMIDDLETGPIARYVGIERGRKVPIAEVAPFMTDLRGAGRNLHAIKPAGVVGLQGVLIFDKSISVG